jgi:hypothetical protein
MFSLNHHATLALCTRATPRTRHHQTHWNGQELDMFAAIRVDGTAYLLMGDASRAGMTTPPVAAVQHWTTVRATQSTYGFTAGESLS